MSESKSKGEEQEADEAGGEQDVRHLDDVNEEDLGEDVFAQAHEIPATTDSQTEPWLSSDRDYTYQEVSFNHPPFHSVIFTSFGSFSNDSMPSFTLQTPPSSLPTRNATPSLPHK